MALDPKIGRFELVQFNFETDSQANTSYDISEVGVKDFPFDEDPDVERWGALYSTRQRGGIYTASDMNSLYLKGATFDFSKN